MSLKQPKHNIKYAGFSLIEVLIALVVLSVGLLGLAGLQATSLRNNQSAYLRSQATQLAYDMADRIRANQSDNKNLANSTYVTILPVNAVIQSDCASVGTSCTAEVMAQNDLYQWGQDIVNTLPSGTGSITVNAATQIFTVTVNWDDNRDGNVDQNDPNFQMSFHP